MDYWVSPAVFSAPFHPVPENSKVLDVMLFPGCQGSNTAKYMPLADLGIL
jgi:hypothetical protein